MSEGWIFHDYRPAEGDRSGCTRDRDGQRCGQPREAHQSSAKPHISSSSDGPDWLWRAREFGPSVPKLEIPEQPHRDAPSGHDPDMSHHNRHYAVPDHSPGAANVLPGITCDIPGHCDACPDHCDSCPKDGSQCAHPETHGSHHKANSGVGVPRCPVDGQGCSTCRIGGGNGTGETCARMSSPLAGRRQRAREAYYDDCAKPHGGPEGSAVALEAAIETATRVQLSPDILAAARAGWLSASGGSWTDEPGPREMARLKAAFEAAGFEVVE